MRKIKKKFRKLNNRGSSIVMVIVSLAFIGIIVGALLTAAGYAYRLKLQDLNARDNFYYVEQAMNEIYAGVGSQVVEDMKEAYIYTVEHMVEYDLKLQSYVTIDNDEAEEMFHERFMKNIAANPFFNSGDNAILADELRKFISNDTVVLDDTKLYMQPIKDADGNLDKYVIRNVTLTRTQDYSKSVANGAYTQTISTDIEIGQPDFAVLFNSSGSDYANIFNYALVSDMGVEVNQFGTPLTIAGNVYAAADYYNKKYNESTYKEGVTDDSKKYVKSYIVNGEEVVIDRYTHGSVTSKKYNKSDILNEYYNTYSTSAKPEDAGKRDFYDGVNERSMYSGLYINGSSVSILADTIIVPGSIAVMNDSSLTVYGKDGKMTSESEIWTDNLVLGGYSKKVTKADDETSGTSSTEDTYEGSNAVLRANLFVKDDTEINAAGASLQIRGSYYGYGDSTERDERVFIPTVDLDNFQVDVIDESGDVTGKENRGHYNSSAIIVNGEKSTLDLSSTRRIYLAGRSYIELSKDIDRAEDDLILETVDDEGEVVSSEDVGDIITETYTFVPKTDDLNSANPDDTVFLRDYKMGESISLKSNQQAYIPVMYTGMPEAARDTTGKFLGYWEAELHTGLQGSALFEKFFPEAVYHNKIPCVMQEVSNKKYYYYDFETVYNQVKVYVRDTSTTTAYEEFLKDYPSAQYYAAQFIEDYVAELNNENSVIRDYLTDIGDYEDFEAGTINLPDTQLDDNIIYSSGAITTKSGTEFNIVRSDNMTDLSELFSSISYNSGNAVVDGEVPDALKSVYKYSNDLEMEYDYVKWNLGHYDVDTDPEKQYIKELVNDSDYGDASITPINRFMNFDVIKSNTDIKPNISGSDNGTNVLDLASGYSVWVSNESVTVEARDGDGGAVRGMVISKKDVEFASNVTSFEGIIIAGGKVYVNRNLINMTASAEICRAILRECQLSDDENCETVLNLFKDYEISEDDTTTDPDDTASDTDAKTIDNIDYSDVVHFSNWMKNVE